MSSNVLWNLCFGACISMFVAYSTCSSFIYFHVFPDLTVNVSMFVVCCL